MEGWISLIETIISKRAFIAVFFVGIGLLKYFGFDYAMIQDDPIHSIFGITTLCLFSIVGMYYNISNRLSKLESEVEKRDVDHFKRSHDLLFKTITNIARDIQSILELNIITNNAVKNIPRKEILLQTCSINTKYLMIYILESYLDYISAASNTAKSDAIDNSRNRFERQFAKQKKDFLNSLYGESKDTLSLEIRPIIEEKIDDCFNKILNEVSPNTNLTEKNIYIIINEIRALEEKIMILYENNLLLTSFEIIMD